MTNIAPVFTVKAKNNSKMKKYSAFSNSLVSPESYGIDDNTEYSSITVLLSSGALHYIL